jgi:uncharacterized protein (TIGR02452 family)
MKKNDESRNPADTGTTPEHAVSVKNTLKILPCLDSQDMADACQAALLLPRGEAIRLGQSAVAWSRQGWYPDGSGQHVDIATQVAHAISQKRSIPPESSLPPASPVAAFPETLVQVSNETTLQAARRLSHAGTRVLALNFANGINPGGGFLSGARAQEEALCRSSALYLTLENDPMYSFHAARPQPDSSAWCILSPDVPVFRTDDGSVLAAPRTTSFITCAAPVAYRIGVARSALLMEERIRRVYAIARAHGYNSLVLGAWGCGAFGNDAIRIARSFRSILAEEFPACFGYVALAVTDWSDERRFLGPFRDAFQA